MILRNSYIIIFFIFFFLSKINVFALNESVSISPPFIDISVNENQSTSEFEVSLINNSKSKIQANVSSVDFTVNSNYSGVIFQGLEDKNFSGEFSLASWLEIPENNVLVEANSSKKIKVKIKNSNLLPPGGRYGAVLFKLENTSDLNKNLSINQTYSTLVFLKKLGGELPKISLEKFVYKNKIFAINKNVEITLKNEGKYHIIPRGTVKIYDSFGNNIYKGIINSESFYLLPNTNRDFKVFLNKVKKNNLFGLYKIEISYRYDGLNDFTKIKKNFVYINPIIIFIIVILILYFSLKKLIKN